MPVSSAAHLSMAMGWLLLSARPGADTFEFRTESFTDPAR
jgi:hypothetical protein